MTKLVSVPGADPFCDASESVLPAAAEEMPDLAQVDVHHQGADGGRLTTVDRETALPAVRHHAAAIKHNRAGTKGRAGAVIVVAVEEIAVGRRARSR